MTEDTVNAMIESRRVRWVVGVVAGACILATAGVAVASTRVAARPTASVESAMPARPLNIPIMRGFPPPMPMTRTVAAEVKAPEPKRVAKKARRSKRSRTPAWLVASKRRR